ncbi:C-factor [Hyphodiscus hymeniophilus]|uniref:C-factor n=1 Tax=Hyphodiscus hymeniophilus TaxID=353542 RepID=A0A9P7AUQ3_9HELO|nr:C-factor [Hyphodiscus hymeniophilus]
MPNILIIGATRGLGASLANTYASHPSTTVFGTTRSAHGPKEGKMNEKIIWVPHIDVSEEGVGAKLVNQLGMLGGGGGMNEGGVKGFDVVAKFLPPKSKVILVSSESGSITLRHEKEGGGNYAHHASKSALNMVGKLLSLDLKDEGVIISIVHPGFMRTEMTAGVGFDKFWDDGGAVTPDEAAKSLIEWAEKLDMSKSGEYWAPRGPRDIGTAEVTIGKNLPTPLQLPW